MTAAGLARPLPRATVTVLLTAAMGCSGATGRPPPAANSAISGPVAPETGTTTSAQAPLPTPPKPTVERPDGDRSLQLPPIAHHQLSSGLELTVVDLPSRPVTELQLVIDAGGLADRPGVAELTAELVARGAASKHRRTGQFAQVVASIGSELEVQVDGTHTLFRMTVSSDQLHPAIGIFGEMVAERQLGATTYHGLRARALALAAARAGDDVTWVSEEILQRSLLGAGVVTSRRATHGTFSELSRIRHAHCNKFYADHYLGARTRLIIVGRAPLAATTKAAEKALARYSSRPPEPLTPVVTPPWPVSQAVYLVNHRDAPLSAIAVGSVTANVKPAELPALQVFETLLSEALSAEGQPSTAPPDGMPAPEIRLGRLLEGHYLVVASAMTSRDQTGHRLAALATRLRAFGSAPTTAGQVAKARRQLGTRLAATSSSPERLAHLVATLQALGGNDDDYRAYPTRLKTVSTDAIDRLRTSLSGTRVMVIVGDAEKVGPQLTQFGVTKLVNPKAGFGTIKTLRAGKR